MLNLIRTMRAPLFSLIFLMLGSGLFNTFVSIRLKMEEISPEIIGIVTSAMYFGILVGSWKIDRWISRVGLVKSFIPLALSLAILAILQGVWMNPYYWAFCRFIGGICSAGIMIILESWFLMQSGPNMRSRALSLYLAVLYGSLSLGQLLINVADPRSIFPFCLTALLVFISILPISKAKVEEPKQEESVRFSIVQLFKTSPLGLIGGIISGMILAVVYGLVPVFAKEIGMSLSEVGSFMAIIIFGGLTLQWPIARWADKGSRHSVIQIISFVTAFLGITIGMVTNLWLLHILAFLFGGFAFTLYPLSMAHSCANVKESEIIAVTGGFTLSYGIGAILGPILAPIAMSYMGSIGVFYFVGLISLILALVGLKKPTPAPS